MPDTAIAFITPMVEPVREVIAGCAHPGQRIRFALGGERAELEALVRDADVIVAAGSAVDAALLDAAPRVRLVQKWGVGIDRIDVDAARARGIAVAITAGASAGPISEHALALLLAVRRRLPLADRQVRAGIWQPTVLRTICRQVDGSTIGLLGFGNIARRLALRLRGFEVEVIYHSRTRADAVTEKAFGVRHVSFDELLARSDVLSLHLPLTDATRGLIDRAAIARMKDGAVLVNTARGAIVDEDALHDALVSGKLDGAGLDNFSVEPVPRDHPLLRLDQVVVTPHSAGSVFDHLPVMAGHVLANVDRFARGEPLAPADLVVPPGR